MLHPTLDRFRHGFLLVGFAGLLTIVSLELRAQSAATGIPYFQQHVAYSLDATFHDDLARPSLDGKGSLQYTNNSPDTLHELYFHLYWNLFRHGSYGERAPNRDHKSDQDYGRGGIDINGVSLGGIPMRYEIDNTIMRVELRKPCLPGASLPIEFSWHGVLPNYGIRSTWGWHDMGARNFATAQWYPQVCVYDNHGWHADQYIGMGEFYTDYGSFDVSLHMPERFSTVVSTGYQTNSSETLPDSAIHNLEFARAHPDSLVRIEDHAEFRYAPIDTAAPLKIWKFHADSVRDFAWCADEAYIWDAIYDNGTMHNALYWENSRAFWGKDAAKIAHQTIQQNSKFAGQYLYPNAFMCETYEGGMEYPGIVFIGPYSDGSTYHWAQNTMMHELGHEWYPMMMGSNETDYGYMDEGFNTFITTFVQEAWFGRYNNSYGPGLGYNDDERTSNYRSALLQQLSGLQEPAEQKADAFRSYRAYANATYPHTSSVFFMLRYVMGESAFDHFMHLYYDRWHLKHPYPDDIMNAAEDVERTEGDTNRVRARGDLRWFFDQWFKKTWKLDYAIGDFDVTGTSATVRIDRKERAVMPIDLVFTLEDGSSVQKWIAVDDWLRTVADRRSYTYTFASRPVSVKINPTNELLDVDRLNNRSGWLPATDVQLIPRILGDVKPIDKYAIRSAPFLAPSTGDFKASPRIIFGWTVLGSYLDRSDRIALGVRAGKDPSGSGFDVGGVLQYQNVVDWLSPWTDVGMTAIMADKTEYYGARLAQVIEDAGLLYPKHVFNFGYDLSGAVLLQSASNGWRPMLNRLSGGYTFHEEAEHDDFTIAGEFETGLGDPRTSYTKLAGMVDDRYELGAGWDAFGRIFGGSMQPNGGTIPEEAKFRTVSTSDVDHFEDLYGSNFGTEVRNKIRNAAQSGPMLRGYYQHDTTARVAVTATIEIGNHNLFPFTLLRRIPVVGSLFHLFGLTLFADAGVVTDAFCTCRLKDDLRSDAGVGLRFIGQNGFINRAFGLDLDRTEGQLDFPLWISEPGTGNRNFGFRFMGIIRQNF